MRRLFTFDCALLHPDEMPLQNRVSPFGDIVAEAARGTLMGNRGCFHDHRKQLSNRRWANKSWICCTLDAGGFKRELMAPSQYTELFFLDEATALAAGHRPCAQCRRAEYRHFTAAWAAASLAQEQVATAALIDSVLHLERTRSLEERMQRAADLPNGVIVSVPQVRQCWLKWQGHYREWSFNGYSKPDRAPSDVVVLLTPLSTARAISAGYVPGVHLSATI